MQITVNGQSIAIVDDTLVSNSVNIYECEFEFDASWDGFSKTSVWQLNSDDPIEVVIDSGVAVIPHEVLQNAGILRIGVYGTKDEKVMPTVWLEKRKVCLGTPTGSIGTEPTPSIYAQILAVATEAKDIAEDVQTEWENVSATAETLPSGSSATASFSDGVFSFGIPQGEKGEDGDTPTFTVTPIVTPTYSGNRITIEIDGSVTIFDVKNGANGAKGEDGVGITDIELTSDYCLEITLSNGTVITTPSIRGEKGEDGNGIASITKTATVGKVDTYTITYTDGTTTTFDVTNGEVTEASLEEALIDKADVIENTASGTIATFNDGAEMPVKSLEVEINAVQSGSGDPSPTNIRPISGWDAVNVVRTGKNLLVNKFYGGIPYNGTIGATVTLNELSDTVQSGDTFSRAIGGWGGFGMCSDKLPNGTYYLKAELTSPNMRSSVYVLDRDMAIVRNLGNIGSGTTRSIANAVTLSGNESRIAFVCSSSTAGTVTITAPQIELGSTASSYSEYNGTTYPITLPNTCYGGKIKDGVQRVTHGKYITPTTNPNFQKYTSGNNSYFYLPLTSSPFTLGYVVDHQLISDTYPAKVISSSTTDVGIDIFNSTSGQTVRLAIRPENVSTMTATEFNTWIASNPITVIYELATPTEITLSDFPTVETLKGINNLWSDSGDVAVIYRADTKKYIDGTIVDVPLAMIAPIENGTTSSKAYAVGEYFILNGTQFCKAKTSIASGATFTLNTNYTVTTIATELKALQ